MDRPLAVSAKETQKWGCPYCGYRSGHSPISDGSTSAFVCGECHKGFAILAKGVKKSTFGFGEFYPELSPHPRRGTRKHGTPDEKPEGGGEFFGSRGIGLDTTPGCFVCGGKKNLHHNIAAFVQGRAAGKRVVAMFRKGAWLDWRPYEPDRVQVKIGACEKHLLNLELLDYWCSDSIISRRKIADAVVLKPKPKVKDKSSATRLVASAYWLAYYLRKALQKWAKEAAEQEVAEGLREKVPNYRIPILRSNGGDHQQLIFRGELICELRQTGMMRVDLHLGRLPVGPWDDSRVVTLFHSATQDEEPATGIALPKIAKVEIKPRHFGFRSKMDGFHLDIEFTTNLDSDQTNVINGALNNGLDSPDCCHFFSRSVGMFFPRRESAEEALTRLKKAYGLLPPKIWMTLKGEHGAFDASDPKKPRSTVVPAGRYEVERIVYPPWDSWSWIVLKGTRIGYREDKWLSYISDAWRELKVEFEMEMPKVAWATIEALIDQRDRDHGYSYRLTIDLGLADFVTQLALPNTDTIADALLGKPPEATCAHFQTHTVWADFPTEDAAEKALARVEALCGKA